MTKKFDLSLLSRHRLFLYGAATVLIMISHLATELPFRGLWAAVVAVKSHGMVGVEIFLLLCGFGLYGSLSRNFDLGRFYGRRIVRVFLPAFVVAAVCCAAVYMPLEDYLSAITVIPYFLNGKSFWYAAFILVMYAVYPLIFLFQKRSPRAFAVFAAAASVCSVAACAVLDMPGFRQIALTRIPVFLMGCVIAPWVTEGRKISVWWLPASAAAFAVLEAVRCYISMGSYAIRAVAFLPFTVMLVMILAWAAEFFAKKPAGNGVYRVMGFMGTISLETYLVQERMQNILLLVKGYEDAAFCDMLKIDISAIALTVITAYLINLFCRKLIGDFSAIPVPKVNSDIT